MTGLESKLAAALAELDAAAQRNQNLESKNAGLTSDLNSCNQKGADLSNDNAALDQKLQECENKASGLKKDLDATNIKSANKKNELDSEIFGLKQQLSTAESDLAKMTGDHTACNGREKTCAEEKARLNASIEKLTSEIDASIETKKSLEEKVDTLTSESGDQV